MNLIRSCEHITWPFWQKHGINANLLVHKHKNNIALTENNTEPSIDENNNTKQPKDEPADDDRSAATTPHCV